MFDPPSCISSYSTEEWKTVALSLAGEDHLKNDTGCQDYYLYSSLPNKGWIGVVADGMGSAKHGALGAKIAVETALDFIVSNTTEDERCDEKLCKQAFLEARKHIAENASLHEERSIRDYAATLAITIVYPDRAICGSIGDSGTPLGLQAEENIEWMNPCAPHKGEYANQTAPITMSKLEENIIVKEIQGSVRYAFAMTDGVLEMGIRLKDNTTESGFFNPLSKLTQVDSEKAFEFLQKLFRSKRVVEEHNGDDKTIIITEFLRDNDL